MVFLHQHSPNLPRKQVLREEARIAICMKYCCHEGRSFIVISKEGTAIKLVGSFLSSAKSEDALNVKTPEQIVLEGNKQITQHFQISCWDFSRNVDNYYSQFLIVKV